MRIFPKILTAQKRLIIRPLLGQNINPVAGYNIWYTHYDMVLNIPCSSDGTAAAARRAYNSLRGSRIESFCSHPGPNIARGYA